MKCSKCGSENNEDARFCTFCGNDLGVETQNSGSVNENQGFENNQQRAEKIFRGKALILITGSHIITITIIIIISV